MNIAKRLAGILLALLALVLSAWNASPVGYPVFLAILVLPVLAALLLLRPGPGLCFTVGAIYAVAAGVQRLYFPNGDTILVNQISTAALVALVLPVVWQAIVWILRAASKENEH